MDDMSSELQATIRVTIMNVDMVMAELGKTLSVCF